MFKRLKEICEILKNQDDFLVVSHAMPDGDAVGSQLGMAQILKNLNKNFRLYNLTGIPPALKWINPGFKIAESIQELDSFKPNVCIFLDCGDESRAGQEIKNLLEGGSFPTSICIDHHRENPEFATVNWVDPTASATTYLMAQVAKELGLALDGQLGKCIYLGLAEDTGSFSYGNTDARTLALAAEIVELGLNVGEFSACRENTWSLERFTFWGKLSNSVQFAHNNTIAYVCVTHAMLDEAGLTVADLSDFASWMRRIRGTKACALFREHTPGKIKVSLRSAPGVNVQKVAVHFGGGGHFNAAAMEIEGDFDNVISSVLPLLVQEIDLSKEAACDQMNKAENFNFDGVLVVNKPKGPSSVDCLNQVKRALGIKKAGHAGTLDPMASGVLLLLLGQATKLSSYLMNRKIYSGTIELGRTTDTWDAEGKTIETKKVDNITPLQVKQAVEDWLCQTEQEVPSYSAAKHEGQPLYKLSRQGLPTPVKTKAIQIFRAEMLTFDLPYIKFRVECSSGTYIRSLAHSLGIRLGKGATLTELTREYSHPFSIEQAVSAEEAVNRPDLALTKIQGITDALYDWPKVTLNEDLEAAVKNGKQVPCPSNIALNSQVLVVNMNNQPLAISEAVEGREGSELKVLRGLWH